MGAGWLLGGHGHPFSPRLFHVAFPDWPSRAAPTDRHTERTLAFFSCQDTPHTLALSCSGQGHSLASRLTLHHSLDGIPEAACAQKKNVSCSAFKGHPRPTRTTLEHPASPSRLLPATLETHAKGPSSQPWACWAHPHSRIQMLLQDTDREADQPKLTQLDRVKPGPESGLLSSGPLR